MLSRGVSRPNLILRLGTASPCRILLDGFGQSEQNVGDIAKVLAVQIG